MPIPFFVAAIVGAKAAWFGIRFKENEFDFTKTKDAMLRDIPWQKVVSFGKHVADLVDVILEAPIDINCYDDFKREVERISWCKEQIDGYPETIRSFMIAELSAFDHLEKRMKYVVMEYAILLGGIEKGTPTEQLSALYMSLYLIGRLGKTLKQSLATQMVAKLGGLHQKRRQPIDARVRVMFEQLSSANAPTLAAELRNYTFMDIMNIDPDYIIYALTGIKTPKLTFGNLFDEIVQSIASTEKQKAA